MTARVLFLLSIVVFALTIYANSAFWVTNPKNFSYLPPFKAGINLNRGLGLGSEYINIAYALSLNKGFSNPFLAETGPTAWMPPLYPVFLSVLLLGYHQYLPVTLTVAFFNALVLIFTGYLIFRVAKETAKKLDPAIAVGLYCLWLLVYFFWFFQLMHDIWLNLIGIDLLFLFSTRLYSHKTAPKRDEGLDWGLLGGLAFLANPILGNVWLIMTAILFLRRFHRRQLTKGLLIGLAICSVWVGRNALVFKRFVFIKSNFYYDLNLANYVHPDGVYDEAFFTRYHLVNKLGPADKNLDPNWEMNLSDESKRAFFEHFKADPVAYFRKAKNRLLAATLWYWPYQPLYEGERPVVRTLIHLFPFLGMLFTWLATGRKTNPWFKIGCVIYTFYLIPYVLVAFYNRYYLGLSSILVLFMFWGADALANERLVEKSA